MLPPVDVDMKCKSSVSGTFPNEHLLDWPVQSYPCACTCIRTTVWKRKVCVSANFTNNLAAFKRNNGPRHAQIATVDLTLTLTPNSYSNRLSTRVFEAP
jgi:hypothetical protein